MSNRVSVNVDIWPFLVFIVVILCLLRCSSGMEKKPMKPFKEEVHQVVCISESGDTIKVWKTYDIPGKWESQGIMCYTFRDIETGKPVEIRTRTGIIVWQ